LLPCATAVAVKVAINNRISSFFTFPRFRGGQSNPTLKSNLSVKNAGTGPKKAE
jgi:hypothetical protein